MDYKQKIKYYCDLAVQTEKQAVASRNNWTSVLDTSAKMYKYSFADQLMIHAQYPNATACASYEMWNKSFNRWIKGGTKGIVLLDTSSGRPKLNYVFDVSDTQVYKEKSRSVDLWQLKEEHEQLVLSQLDQIYDAVDIDNLSIANNFHNIANQLATEYYGDNSREIRIRAENSFVEDYDDDNLRVAFIDSVSTSIAYVLMKRCGYDVSEYFTEEDFDHITDFNSADALYAVGEAVSDLSEQVLRDVELAVKKHERQKANELALNQTYNVEQERNVENERNNRKEQSRTIEESTKREQLDNSSRTIAGTAQTTNMGREIRDGIHSSGGLHAAEPISIGGSGQRAAVGQIRINEEGLSQTASQNNIRNDEQQGNSISSLQGNRTFSGSEIRTSDEVSNSQSQFTQQRSRPNGLDGRNEYVETSSRRTDTERTDSRLHLNDNETKKTTQNQGTEQLSKRYSQVGNTFLTANIEQRQPSEKLTQLLSTSSITIDEVDFILRDGGNDRNSILRITAHFAKNLSIEEDAVYLRDEYLNGKYWSDEPRNGGKGFKFDGKETAVWFDELGIKIGRGKSVISAADFSIIPWEQAADHVKQLYNAGLFVNHDVLEEALHNEYFETADNILNLYNFEFRDLIDKPESWQDKEVGWESDRNKLAELLKQFRDKDGRKGYMDVLNQVYVDLHKLGIDPVDAIVSETSPLSVKKQNKAINIFKRIEKLVVEPTGFQVSNIPNFNVTRFITDDEINNYLTNGSNFSESKMRILSYFLNNRAQKERANFLKDEYGNGGGTWFGIDNGYYKYIPSKGIILRRKDCVDVTLNWDAAAKRIHEIIFDGRYISENYLERTPSYEKLILAREIDWFFKSLPIEDREVARHSANPELSSYISPFSEDADFYYSNQKDRDIFNTFFENEPNADGVRPIDACLEKMQYILENIAEEDRHYSTRKMTLSHLTDFRNGTYSLFPNVDKLKNVANINKTPISTGQSISNTQQSNITAETSKLDNIAFSKPASSQQIALFESMSFTHIPSVAEQQSKIEKANETVNMMVTSEEIKNKELASVPKLEINDTVKTQNIDITKETATTGLTNEISLDFDVVAELVLESILNNNNYLEEMAVAKSRSSLRSVCSSVLESIIINEDERNEVYEAYYSDDEFNDRLFNYILRKSWEHQQQLENENDEKIIDKIEIDGVTVAVTTRNDYKSTVEPEQISKEINNTQEHHTVSDYENPKDTTDIGEFEPPSTKKYQEEIKQPKPPNFRINDDNLGHGGVKSKFRANVEAIKTLHAIESENRYATPKEQEILSRYVGWGGIQEAFDETKEQWANEFAELSLLLTDSEYKSARKSVLNAHYTSPTVVKAIYDTVLRMGFKTGNLLEPSVGVGNFFGLLPENMNNVKLYGVELDSISARIAKQLYPNSTIKEMGYEKADYPDNFFDIAIGNVPFGDYGVIDKKYDKHKFKIHDYFLAKTLDQVRPGGIIAFVTSKGTLDKANSDVRKYLAQRAELLGAVRLPNTAFKANAGTEVTSDIIFLQKRDRIIDIDPQDSKFDWVHLGQINDAKVPNKQISINRYFIDNPEMVLGEMTTDSGSRMHGVANITACVPFETMLDGSPATLLAEQLQKVILNIEGQITIPEVSVDIDDLDCSSLEAIPDDPDVKNFSFTVIDDIVYFRENSIMYPVEQPATTLERIKGMVGLRDCVRELIRIQVDEYDEYVGKIGDKMLKEKQAELEVLYNKFNKNFGRINASANNRAFAAGQFSDNSYYLLCSLEVFDEDGNFKRKGDMFTKRTIKQKNVITHVDTSTEALAISMGEKAKVDIKFMAQLTGFTPEKIMQDLKGVIYCDITIPNRATQSFDHAKMNIYEKYPLVTADEFLSGNVREKLEKAKLFKEAMPDEIQNIDVEFIIKALQAAMPKDLEAHEINFRLGSTWIDPIYVQQFMYKTFQTSSYNQDSYQVKYHSASGEWNVTGKGRAVFGDIPTTVTYGTKRANAYEILCDTLNLKDVRVYDYFTDENGKKTRELNKKETAIAQQKQEQIKSLFKDWLFKNPERRQTLVKLYNEKFNSNRPREYDGSHINFSGISPEIKLRKHQLNAIAHILYGGNTLLAHEVGAGKTFEIVAAAMESKRLGLTNKSLIAVPNHLTEQWGSEWLRLYPSANILVATKKDFEPRNRKKFIAKIATGDYNAVIIGHTQLEKIPLSKERQERILQEQLDEIVMGIKEVEASKGDRITIKQMEKTRNSVELKIQKLAESKKRDNVVTFEELGCDKLYIDESHNFKNLILLTKMRNCAGLSATYAQKSTDLFIKCRYMDELTTELHGRPCGTVFATGTPISNSIAELYTIQRYLQYDVLMEKDFTHFDAWASAFCEPETSIELSPDNSGYRARTRLATFHNLPELMAIFRDVADIKTADMLDLPVPTAIYETIVAEPSEIQQEMVKDLSERATKVQRRAVDPRTDNMLKITTDGRKIGLDQRLINDMFPDFEGSKVNIASNNVYNIWEETKKDRLTQLVFCDFSTPNKDGRFNVYEDIRSKLIMRGIPDNEIAFIHNANTETQKKELFSKVRQGKVRVLFGSTAKMGAGNNVQDKLIAIHDVDCPWRPADLEQRRGRIVRQGNKNDEVKIFRYATEATFDAYLWQTVQKKQEFISQIMTSKSPVRSCEDVDETALSYAEIKALCAGDPLIAEKMKLDVEVAKLRMGKAEHQSQHYRLEDALLNTYPKQIAAANERISNIEADMKLYEKHNVNSVDIQKQSSLNIANDETNNKIGAVSLSAKFAGMIVNGITYSEKEPAGKAILDACKALQPKEPMKIGEYMGFEMSLIVNTSIIGKNIELLLKGSSTYKVDIGTDTFGNITRINNSLENLPSILKDAQDDLAVWEKQQRAAKDELKLPFHLSDELTEKETRLTELNIKLNIDNEQETAQPIEGDNSDANTICSRNEVGMAI